jgi:TonB family protein
VSRTRVRRLEIAMMAGILACFAFGAGATVQANTHKTGPPDVASATDIAYPVNTTATGMVALLLTVDVSGSVQSTSVLQDTPPLTPAAQAAIQKWKFTAGGFHGKAATTLLPVYIVFNPYNPAGTAPVGGGLQAPPAMPPHGSSEVPPQIRLASYAMYPPNTLATGTVVLSVNVNKSGHATNIRVVHGVHPLRDAATDVVKQWGFQPATSGGETVAGRICIAFVFQRNLS